MAGYLRNDGTDPPELRRLLEFEAEVMETADLFQANTDAVMETIRANYDQSCDARPLARRQHRPEGSGSLARSATPTSGRRPSGVLRRSLRVEEGH